MASMEELERKRLIKLAWSDLEVVCAVPVGWPVGEALERLYQHELADELGRTIVYMALCGGASCTVAEVVGEADLPDGWTVGSVPVNGSSSDYRSIGEHLMASHPERVRELEAEVARFQREIAVLAERAEKAESELAQAKERERERRAELKLKVEVEAARLRARKKRVRKQL